MKIPGSTPVQVCECLLSHRLILLKQPEFPYFSILSYLKRWSTLGTSKISSLECYTNSYNTIPV